MIGWMLPSSAMYPHICASNVRLFFFEAMPKPLAVSCYAAILQYYSPYVLGNTSYS